MTEISYYWLGTTVGDATEAPYLPVRYHANWKILFTETDDEGYIRGYLNELIPTGGEQQISIASGAALVNGWFYVNDSAMTFDIDIPSANPRIDLIVLKMSAVAQTARLAKITGTEGAPPTAPSLTQNATIWEIPIAQIYIDTAGTMSVIDTRFPAKSPMMPQAALIKIDEIITTDNNTTKFIFSNIPQIYRHLMLVIYVRSMELSGVLRLQINDGDEYPEYQAVLGDNAAISATAFSDADTGYNIGGTPASISNVGYFGAINIKIQNYTSSFYKTMISNNFSPRSNVLGNFELFERGGIILDENPITTITLWQTNDDDRFQIGCVFSLYGMD